MDKSKDGFLGVHHGYLGLLLMLIGFILVFTKLPIWVSLIFIVLGLPIFGSDYYQHYRQKTEPDYQDRIHKIYVWALRKMMKKRCVRG